MAATGKTGGTWTGWVGFAGIVMIVIGGLNVVEGLIAVIRGQYYVLTADQILLVDFRTWGWILIVWGVIVALAGCGLLAASAWARWFTIIVAGLNIFIQLGFAGSSQYPLWALTVLALNIVVFYALTVRWDEAKRGLGSD
ncbi:MAG TPA: hypothetical protein VLV46_12185 [Gaiellaceae bacterium]|nr:hypothetical protein [Gaiellaceae bacterium]